MSFDTLGLAEPLLRAVNEYGYTTPTPIQTQAIPLVLSGVDVMGGAQTGTGKTAGFVLPMLQRLMEKPVEKDSRGKSPIRARARPRPSSVIIGSTKPAVLPVPVWAMPKTSRPSSAGGIAPA